MKPTIFSTLLFAFVFNLYGQNNEIKHIFKYPKISMQWDLGKAYYSYTFNYANTPTSRKYNLHGTTLDLIGIVIKDKINLALGIDYVSVTPQNFERFTGSASDAYRLLDYGNFYLKIEPIIWSYKIINFSFPIKIGFGGTDYEYISTTSSSSTVYTGTISEQFMLTSLGANSLVNIYKNLSIGIGGSYRHLSPISQTNQLKKSLNTYSAQLFLRFKIGKKYE